MRPTDWPGLGDVASALEDGVGDVVLGAAARFVGRAISRRVQRTVSERVLPALAVKHEAIMREQIAIAERHPDLLAQQAQAGAVDAEHRHARPGEDGRQQTEVRHIADGEADEGPHELF